MTSAQIEAADVEVLADATSVAVAETVYTDALAGANPDAAAEVAWVEVLTAYVGTTSEVGSVYVEVLSRSPLQHSNVWDSSGTEHQMFRFDGTSLVQVSF
jgi:hypothetical protein